MCIRLSIVALFCLSTTIVVAQHVAGPEDAWRAAIHTKPLSEMTKEELRAYKAAVEAKARELGILSQSKGYTPLSSAKRAQQKPMPKRIPGTMIQYDSGTVTGTAGVASQMLGNRFDSALNPAGTMCCFPVENSGTITMVTFNMVATFFGSAVYSYYTNISGTMANQVTSMALAGVMTGVNTRTLGGNATLTMYENGAFLAGIWQFNVTMTGLGVDTGTNGGQGFHGISLNDGMVGTMLTDLMSLNAVFRVGGNVATPVELMNFEVD